MGIFSIILPSIAKIVVERIATKSSIAGAVPLTVAAAVGTGQTPIPVDSFEGLIAQVVMGILGIYLLLKKEKAGEDK